MAGTARPPGRAVRRDRRPHRGDRPLGAGAQGPLAVLQPHGGGQQLRHPLPPAGPARRGRAGRRHRGGRPARGEQILLDENLLAEGHDYFAVGSLAVSPDHRWLAYSTDTTGGERFTMRFVDLETGDPVAGVARGHLLRGGVGQRQRHRLLRPGRRGHAALPALAPPGRDRPGRRRPGLRGARRPLLPRRGPDQGRPLRPDEPRLEGDLRGPGPAPPTSPLGGFSVIEPRRQGIEYSVDHDRGDPEAGRPGRFLIVTNDGAEDFRLMEAPDDLPGRSHWTEVIGGRPGVRLDNVDPFVGHLVVYEREGGETRIRVIDAADRRLRCRSTSRSPRPPCGAGPTPSTSRRRSATSTPRWSRPARSTTSISRRARPSSSSASPCSATSTPIATGPSAGGPRPTTGPEVPISVVYRPDLVADPGRRGPAGPAPCLLYGYGSYEASMDPMFSSLRLSLLDRGFVFAIAHVRGGGRDGPDRGTSRGSWRPSPTRSPTSWPAPGP